MLVRADFHIHSCVSPCASLEMSPAAIAEKAKEVIRKNVLTVQQVARLFGEHIADSEILLNEIVGTYCTKKE